MKVRLIMWCATAGLALAACGRKEEGPVANSPEANTGAGQTAAAVRPPRDAKPASPAKESPPVYSLAGNGLQPGLAFGMKQEEALAAATKAFGAPTGKEHSDECGEGPMDFVSFRGLSLGFQDGSLAGWSLSEKLPALRTTNGLAIGAPRSVLGDAPIDKESTLGPEFNVDDVGGLLDDKEREIIALWAGLTCQFR